MQATIDKMILQLADRQARALEPTISLVKRIDSPIATLAIKAALQRPEVSLALDRLIAAGVLLPGA